MDVKIEGENAVRHLDLTTHNHGSVPGNTPTWPFIDQMATGGFKDNDPCKKDIIKEQEACADYKPYGDKNPCEVARYAGYKESPKRALSQMYDGEGIELAKKATKKAQKRTLLQTVLHIAKGEEEAPLEYHYKGGQKRKIPKLDQSKFDAGSAQDCLTARACQLVPYGRGKELKTKTSCCKGQTGHHIVEAGSFFATGRGLADDKKFPGMSDSEVSDATILQTASKKTKSNYSTKNAPTVCVWGPNQNRGTHGIMHSIQGFLNSIFASKKEKSLSLKSTTALPNTYKTIKYEHARENGIVAHKLTHPTADCSPACLRSQLDNYHTAEVGVADDDEIRCIATGKTKAPEAYDAILKARGIVASDPLT